MCGIFGYQSKAEMTQKKETLFRMGYALRNRGPDDAGFLIQKDRESAFGMRRLSIVDRSGGHQPIYNEDKSLALVFNGEVYNHLDIRDRLIAQGHSFATQSDSEVVLHLFEELGVAGFAELNGIFAFAILDLRKDEFLIVRDRFGVKPALYCYSKSGFAFASELKCLAQTEGFQFELDPQAVSDYFSLSYNPSPGVILKGVKSVPAGSWIRVRSSQIIDSGCYWQPKFSSIKEEIKSEAEWVAEFKTLFQSAVRRQQMGEVPVGAFLSGGLDSGGIVSALAASGERYHTFSVAFDDKDFDETALALKTSARFKTHHHQIRVDGTEILELLDTVPYEQDHPLGLTSYSYFLMAKKAREYVTVCLSGDGGDELFGGYDMYYGNRLIEKYKRVPSFMRYAGERLLLKCLRPSFSKRGFDIKARKFIEAARLPGERAYLSFREIFSPEQKRDLLKLGSEVQLDPYFRFTSYIEDQEIQPIESRFMWTDLRQFLQGTTLTIADRIGMANSLEVRVPFLDNELFEFSQRLPMELKIRGMTTKYLLRTAFRGVIPDEVIKAPKLGFTPPMGKWFNGVLLEMCEQLFEPSRVEATGVLNSAAVTRIWNDHKAKRIDHSRHLMALVSFLTWYERFPAGVARTCAGAKTLQSQDLFGRIDVV